MSTTEITNVERLEPDSDALLGFSIELPVAGTAAEAYSFEFAGWVLGGHSAAVQIELIANDGAPRRIPIVFPRSDVARCYPQRAENTKVGFWAPVSVIGMTPEFELLVRVVLENTERVPIARIRGRHRPLPSRFQPSIQPLLVTSLARTGTTWMMRLLLEHPAITTLRIYPYECRPGRYWMQLVGGMAEPAYPAQARSKLGIFDDEWWAGQDPLQRGSLSQNPALQQWFNARFVEQVALLCQRSLEDCYREIAATQDQRTPIYFAEKHLPDDVPGILWELYPKCREIFVVRDPRDMLCSIRAFNAKRGTLNFSRDTVASEEEYILRLGRDGQQLLGGWKARGNRACLVRYEDLVLRPIESLSKISRYLAIEADSSLLEDVLRRALVDTPELAAHRTAGTARASIGRWRHDLDSSSQLLCEQVFGEFLKEFGYELNQDLRKKNGQTISLEAT